MLVGYLHGLAVIDADLMEQNGDYQKLALKKPVDMAEGDRREPLLNLLWFFSVFYPPDLVKVMVKHNIVFYSDLDSLVDLTFFHHSNFGKITNCNMIIPPDY